MFKNFFEKILRLTIENSVFVPAVGRPPPARAGAGPGPARAGRLALVNARFFARAFMLTLRSAFGALRLTVSSYRV